MWPSSGKVPAAMKRIRQPFSRGSLPTPQQKRQRYDASVMGSLAIKGLVTSPIKRPVISPIKEHVISPSTKDAKSISTDADDEPAPELNTDHGGMRVCLGCMRDEQTATSFFSQDPVEWLYDSYRGSWCRECHTIWRHCRKGTMTLTLYEIHLAQDNRNRVAHMQLVVALISLRIESVKRVSKEILEFRRNMLQTICGILGIPFGPLLIKEWVTQSAASSSSSGGSAMMPIMMLDGRGIIKTVAIEAATPYTDGSEYFTLQRQPQLAWHRYYAEDVGRLGLAFGTSGEGVPAGEETGSCHQPVPDDKDEEPAGPQHGFHMKCKSLVLATTVCLQAVASSSLNGVHFTKEVAKLMKNHMLKLSKGRVSFLHCPYKEYLATIDEMVCATTSAQAFMKAAGIYHKKFTNTLDVFEASVDFVAWCEKHKVSMSVVVQALLFKASLHKACTSVSIDEVKAMFASAGLLEMAKREAANCKQEVSTCVSNMLEDYFHDSIILGFMAMFGNLEELTDEVCNNLESLVRVFLSASENLATALASGARGDGSRPECVTQVSDIFSAVLALASIRSAPNFIAIDKAVTVLEARTANRIHSSLLKQQVGQLLWAAGADVRASGAMDGEAIRTLTFATEILQNENMGHRGDDGGKVLVISPSHLEGGKMANLIRESLDLAMLSMQQWSGAGIQQAVETWKSFGELLLGRLLFVNLAEWWSLKEVTTLLFAWSHYDEAGSSGIDFSDLRDVAKAHLDMNCSCNFLKGPFVNLLSRIDDQLENIANLVKQVPDLSSTLGELDKVVPQFLADARVRSHILREGALICKIVSASLPTTTSQVVDQVNEIGIQGSVLGLACSLYDVKQEARRVSDCMQRELSLIVRLDSSDHSEDINFSDGTLADFVQSLVAGLPLGNYLVKKFAVDFFTGIISMWRESLAVVFGSALKEEQIVAPKIEELQLDRFVKLLGPDLKLLDLAQAFATAHLAKPILDSCLDALPVTTVGNIILRLIDVVPMPFLKQLPHGDENVVTARSAATLFVSVSCSAGQLLSLAAWMQNNFNSETAVLLTSTPDGSACTKYTIQPALTEAFQLLTSKLHEQTEEKLWLVSKTVGENTEIADETVYEHAAGTKEASFVIMGLETVWVPCFVHNILTLLGEKVVSVVKATEALSPSWMFFIDEEKFNKVLAKKQLLTDKCLEALPQQVQRHHNLVVIISGLCEMWGIGKAEEHPALKSILSESSSVLAYAQKTIAVSQAVKVIETIPKGDRQKSAAAALLPLLSADFPAALKKIIQKLSRGQ